MGNETKQLSILHDLSKAIIGAETMEDVCKRILDKTVSVLGVTKASVMKYDDKEGALKIIAAIGLPKEVVARASVKVGEGISGKVFKSVRPLLIKDIQTAGYKSRKRYRSRSLMSAPVTCFPMQVSGKAIGVINVTDKKGGRPFTDEDLKLLTTIANQTAAYLHLSDLAEEAKQAEHMRQELELARKIQQRLLPQKMPKIEGFDVAGCCLTAERVGGDYFDFILGGARSPAVVVADVAGHSIGAAMMMSAFRSAVRAEGAASLLSPAFVVERLNALLYDDLATAEQFISVVYLQLMPKAIRYTTAGHWPPLLLHNGEFSQYSTEDSLIGVECYAEFKEKRLNVTSGDIIVLYTDGLIEAQNRRGTRFGLKRLQGLMVKNKNKPAQKIIEGLCVEIKRYLGERPLADDITVVAIKVK